MNSYNSTVYVLDVYDLKTFLRRTNNNRRSPISRTTNFQSIRFRSGTKCTHRVRRIGGRAPGPQANIQRQFMRDINTGKIICPSTKSINGDYATPQRWGKVKFNKEIRLSFECCVIKGADGVLRGPRVPTFDYTNRWVVTITQYEEECIPRAIRKVKDNGIKRRWVEGERTGDDGIFDDDPVTILKGVGKSTRQLLARMGIKKVRHFARLRQSRIAKLTKNAV